MYIKSLAALLLLLPVCAVAQHETANTQPDYTQDYFRNPLDIPIFLAGNFGECRPGHFHSGTDIKTRGEENQPVHAAASGYVSRIKMEKGGFGHGLYITHPNGYTTLYAHLNDFTPAIQKYVREKQYEAKRWDVDLELKPSQFPVKKGQQVAWSGNTGASTAPHLHFEIRNTKTEHPLNPELFGLPIVDHIAPVVKEVAVYDGSNSVYEQDPHIFTVKKQNPQGKAPKGGNMYTLTDTVVLSKINSAGIGVNMDDFMEGSDNTLAIYNAKLYMDDSMQSEIVLDDIGYDVTRYINAYADYKTHEQHGKWIQELFQEPGNHLDVIFKNLNANKGKLDLGDKQTHKIDILIADDKKNESRLSFYIRGGEGNDKKTAGAMPFYANKPNTFSDPNVSFTLDEKELYDDIDFVFSKGQMGKYSEKYNLHYAYVPVHHTFSLKLKPNRPIPFALRTKMVIRYSDGKTEEGSAAVAVEDGWYMAGVRNFGTYWLDVDADGPVIKSMQKTGANLAKVKQITFQVKDAMTSVKKFSGYLDGAWICFEQHGSSFFYKFDEHCKKGKHELIFKAEDESGNGSDTKLIFTR